MVKFAIFSFPRSGSTFLCSLLGSHPDILCHFEVFHPLEIVTIKDFNDTAIEMRSFTPQTRDKSPLEFLNSLFKYDMGCKAVGFKIFVGHSTEAHDAILKDREIKKILLKRNTIDSYTSMLIAKETGAFTQKDMPPGMSRPRVSFDVGGFLGFDLKIGEYFLHLERVLAETGQEFLDIRYEDMVTDQAVIDSIFSFLGIKRGSEQLSAFTRKQNKSGLQEKVDNLEEAFREMTRLYLKLTKSSEESAADADQLLGLLRSQVLRKDRLLQEIYDSLSWRLTKPLRVIGGKLLGR